MSHASKHFAKVNAKKQTEATPPNQNVDRTQYEKMLLLLDSHKRRLKQIQSLQVKIAKKQEFLPEYQSYLDGVVSAETSPQDDVLVTIMLWNFDCGNLEQALKLGEYALQQKMVMPEQFKRSLACVIAEELADIVVKNPEECQLALVNKAIELTNDQDMPDEVRAKLYKAKGLVLEIKSEFSEAFTAFQKALELDHKCGVKGILQKIEKKLKEAENSAS